jgi:NAD(P)-dependent dehydrogenase (short-subunit alcohol dehydrogenase family)
MKKGRDQFEDKVVLITGSSQGIGKATALSFAEQGAQVILNGRNQERLSQAVADLKATGANVIGIQADLTREAEAVRLLNDTIEAFGRLDILINNAGISMRGHFADLDPIVYRTVFDTNVQGVANLTIPAMQYIREANGSIVFISSLAGIRGLPGLSAYCASKMALRAMAESIRIEEAGSGLHVGLVQVGYTEIEFDKTTVAADGRLRIINNRSKFRAASKESVAKAILRNVRKRKFVTTLTPIGKLNAFLQSIAPGLVERILISQSGKIAERS